MPRAQTIILKDGRTGIIRPVQESDAQGVADTILAVGRAGVGVVRSPAEMGVYTDDPLANVRKFLPGGDNGGARGQMFVALIDHRVVGEGTIRRMSPTRLRHIAHIGLSVHPDSQQLGLGRALMNAMLDWARTVRDPKLPNLARIDLAVFADNTRAVALYRSLGFEVEGVRTRFIRYEDGRETDDLIMALMIEPDDHHGEHGETRRSD